MSRFDSFSQKNLHTLIGEIKSVFLDPQNQNMCTLPRQSGSPKTNSQEQKVTALWKENITYFGEARWQVCVNMCRSRFKEDPSMLRKCFEDCSRI